MKRILVVAQGTYGDVFPMLALAKCLQEAGHQVTVAVEDEFLSKAEAQGLQAFVYIEGVLSGVQAQPLANTEAVMNIVAAATPQAYRKLFYWIKENPVDLVIRHFFDMAAIVLVKKLNLPYVNVFLSGASLFSRYDLPYSEDFKWLLRLAKIPGLVRWAMKLAFWNMLGGSLKKYTAFCRLQGVVAQVPFTEISPYHNLLMCSRLLFPPQPDWPENITVTGYAFLEQAGYAEAEFSRFERVVSNLPELPIILTLGSSGLDREVEIYRQAVSSLRRVYPTTPLVIIAHNRIKNELEGLNVMVFDRIDYARAFPYARLIYHQGGLGTTMEALRSGRPQVIVSRLADRPDNAKRIERLGCGLYEPDLSIAGIERSQTLLSLETLQKCREAAQYIKLTPWKILAREALQDYLHAKESR